MRDSARYAENSAEPAENAHSGLSHCFSLVITVYLTQHLSGHFFYSDELGISEDWLQAPENPTPPTARPFSRSSIYTSTQQIILIV